VPLHTVGAGDDHVAACVVHHEVGPH
jgi:hypothetical protein